MSEQEKQSWFQSLPLLPCTSGVRICNGCDKAFIAVQMDFHYPHREQSDKEISDQMQQSHEAGKLYVGENAGVDLNKPTEPILKLRFVLLEKSVTIQLLECDKQRLGFASKPFRFGAADGYNLHYAPHYGLNIDIDTIKFGNKVNAIAFCENVDFTLIKQALIEFAESLNEQKRVSYVSKMLIKPFKPSQNLEMFY